MRMILNTDWLYDRGKKNYVCVKLFGKESEVEELFDWLDEIEDGEQFGFWRNKNFEMETKTILVGEEQR